MTPLPVSRRPGHDPATAPLPPIDVTFADYVARRSAPGLTELLRHSALLVSAERALGNSCVDLAAHAGQASPDVASGFVFPALDAWCAGLADSGVCDVAADRPTDRPTDRPADRFANRFADRLAASSIDCSPLVLAGPRLYLRRYFVAEQRLAAAILTRVTPDARLSGADELAASAPLFRLLFPEAATAADWQALAAVAALRSPLVFVTGGPGTGKTTVAARLLALLLHRDPSLDIAVAAPTGRAAARLTEAIGAAVVREQLHERVTVPLPSVGNTLHRLLGFTPWNGRFRHDAGNPLPYDVVIVDEASMVDVLMMDALFAALKPDARLIVLGDPDQLASVDTGFVLGDVARAAGATRDAAHGERLVRDYLALSGAAESPFASQAPAGNLRDAVIRLRVSHRFGARPGIGRLAGAMQAGDGDAALAVLHDPAFPDVALDASPAASDVGDAAGRAAHMLHPVLPQLERYLAARDPAAALTALASFRLLCALREGEAGVSGLNAMVEAWLARRGLQPTGWYDHRPVLITANDAGLRLFNGDVGITLAVDGVPMVHFPEPGGGVRTLPPPRLPAHETAWAMTVHKAQGSEFDHVRLVLPAADNRLLTRELLYTGITRAKASVSIVGHPDLVRLAAARTVARASGLVRALTGG